MIALLRLVGWLSIASGVILGIWAVRTGAAIRQQVANDPLLLRMVDSGPLILDALPWVIGGLISALLWFALAQILQNQAEASYEQENLRRMVKYVMTNVDPTNKHKAA